MIKIDERATQRQTNKPKKTKKKYQQQKQTNKEKKEQGRAETMMKGWELNDFVVHLNSVLSN